MSGAVPVFETTVERPLDEVETDVRAALGEAGFGVLTEIDVAATLKAKLGVDRAPLRILGACNPQLAHRALEIDPSVAALLPCNVVLESRETGTYVAIVDPRSLLDAPAFADLASEAATKLEAVVSAL